MKKTNKILLVVVCLMLIVSGIAILTSCGGAVENFNLSFKVDGDVYQTMTTTGTELISIPENPTKDGYTFDGWYWDKDEWNKPFTANSLLNAPISSDMSVYARFNPIKYDITYNAEGATNTNPTSYTIEDGFEFVEATKLGYTFKGWYKDSTFSQKVEAVEKGSKGEITLYAKFETVEYTISYENTKDSTNSNVTKYTIESDTIELLPLEKAGYTFEGWYNGSEKVTVIEKGMTGNITLTAKWSAIDYGITYHNVDGAQNNNPSGYNVEVEPLVLLNATKAGYVFLGWYDANNNKVDEIAVGTVGNLDLYAKWKAQEYTATFKDGETVVAEIKFTIETESLENPEVPEHLGYMGTWESYTLGLSDITVKAVYTVVGYSITYHNIDGAQNNNPSGYNVEVEPLVLLNATKAGYVFLGWYDANNNKVDEIAVGTVGNLDLYAKWKAQEYTATFKDGDTVVAEITFTIETEEIENPEVPEHLGYTGAWEEYTLGLSDITVNAVYEIIGYGIIYHNIDGAQNNNPSGYNVELEPLALSDAEKTGYNFAGWYTDSEFTNKISEIAVGTVGDLDLYAKWEAIEYTATFKDGDTVVAEIKFTIETETLENPTVPEHLGYTGAWEEYTLGLSDITVNAVYEIIGYGITYHNVDGAQNNNPSGYNVELEPLALSDAEKTGYNFAGWYTDSEFTNKISEIAVGTVGDLDLYAKWEAIEYTIEYNLYDGLYGEGEFNPTIYTIEDEITFVSPKLDGFTFVGFFTLSEGGERVEGIKTGSIGDVTLYARYIAFDTNGAGEIEYNFSINNNEISKPADPQIDYYTFEGWYLDEAFTEEFNFAIPTKTLTLYAKYTPIVYKITYVLNGGINPESVLVNYTVEDALTLPTPEKEGYSFIGWFTDEGFTSSVVTKLENEHGDKTFYASFKVNQYTISFESNGGTSVAPITQDYNTNVASPIAPTRNGYKFEGWYSDYYLNNAYTFTSMPSTNITLYAKWSLVTYNINYNLGGGINNQGNPSSFTVESADITLKTPSKTGYKFIGWYTDGEFTNAITTIKNGTYDNVTVYANWEIETYNITYVLNGATQSAMNIGTYTVENGSFRFEAPTAPKGHTFEGWYMENSFETPVYEIGVGQTGDITLYAKIAPCKYDIYLEAEAQASYYVYFNLNGADGSISRQKVSDTLTLKYPTVPTRDGYLFGGWYENAECTGKMYDFTSAIASNITLYAKWIDVENPIVINSSTTVTLNGREEQKFTFVPYANGNVTFTTVGSYDTLGVLYDANGNILKPDDDTSADGINFKIVYNVTAGEVYTISVSAYNSTTSGTTTLNVSGNTNVADGGYVLKAGKAQVTYGQSFVIPMPNAREGYKFLGYADTNGNMVTDANGNSLASWEKEEGATFVSKWERMIYTVTFVTSGGTAIEAIELEYGARLDISKYVTTRDNYTFDSWMYEGAEFEATTMPDYHITLTAKWKTFALGEIKYDNSKVAISVNDQITADLFGALCLDTNSNKAEFTVTVSGTQTAGETISVRLVAKSGNKTKQVTITGIKVYGAPTLDFDDTVDYVNLVGGMTAEHFSASGTDSFGNATEIKVYIEGDYKAGDIVTVTIASVDPSGNVTKGYVENVKAYGLPEITYNEDKTGISVNDTLNADLFGATAKDSFGNDLTVIVSKYSGTISAGNTATIRISATDEKGNVTNIDVECKLYGAPTISNATNTNVKVDDEITAELLGVTASDTFGQSLDVSISVKSGEQKAGTTMVVTATATDIAGNVTTKDFTLKVYGTPTISYDREGIKLNESATADSLNAIAKDSFGQNLTVTVKIAAGSASTKGGYVMYGLTVEDVAGNIITIYTSPLGVYDENDIKNSLTYNQYMSDLAKLSSNGEEFDASATDSFGNACTITIEAANGTALKGGQTTSIVIVATDKAGNRVVSAPIESIRIFDIPTVDIDDVLYESTDIEFIAVVYDSFGNELYAEITYEGNQVLGETVVITVKATDDAGNELVAIYEYLVLEAEYVYTLKDDGTYEFTSYTGTDTEITVLDYYNNKPVTSIATDAFKGNTAITKVILPENLKAIPDNAFNGCTSLICMTIPDSVTSIGGYAFADCTSLTSITIPDDVTKISDFTFFNCASLINVKMGKSIKNIGDSAFYSCTNLVSIKLPDSITSIGNLAFKNCIGLNSFVVPDSVTTIGEEAFANCSLLKTMSIGTGVANLPEGLLNGCSALESLTIPFVGSSASATAASGSTLFGYIFGRTSYDGGVATNQIYFYYYNGQIRFSSTFSYCIPSSLKKVTVTGYCAIQSGAFSRCSNITDVILEEKGTRVAEATFYGCSSLENLTMPSQAYCLGYIFGGVSYTGSYNANQAVGPSEVYEYYIPSTLKNVTITSGSFSNGYFAGCQSLVSVTLPKNTWHIPYRMFLSCQNLTTVTIPDSVTQIGNLAFAGCYSLTTLNYLGTIEQWCNIYIDYGSEDENLKKFGEILYINGEYLTELVIPNTVTEIKDYAFSGGNFTKVTLHDRITSIGDYAFYNCDEFINITIPDSVTNIGSYAFYGCYCLIEIYNLSSLNITAGSSSNGYIGCYAKAIHTSIDEESIFKTTEDGYVFAVVCDGEIYLVDYIGSETKLILPDSYNGQNYEIYQKAFYNCDDITKIIIGEGVTSIGSDAFYNCTSLTSVTIGDSVTSIGSDAFNKCTSLTEINFNAIAMNDFEQYNSVFYKAGQNGDGIKVTIGKEVTKIPAYLFYPYLGRDSLPKITSVVFEEGSVCESIGNYAFFGYTNLTSITIPDSVTSIGKFAFYGDNLTSVTFEDANGWYVTQTKDATSGKNLTLTNTSTNATYLKSTYYDCYWYKK